MQARSLSNSQQLIAFDPWQRQCNRLQSTTLTVLRHSFPFHVSEFIFLHREIEGKTTTNRPEEPCSGMWMQWPWLVLSSWVLSSCGWRQEFNHCILLSLKQVHSDIPVKDEICLERVISSYTEAEPFQFLSTASYIIRWLILISGADKGSFFLILLQHPPSTQWVRTGLCCWL